jgi:hypothetical protein
MYGHLDKQPPLLPWDEGLHPYDPVIRNGRVIPLPISTTNLLALRSWRSR